MKNLFEIIGTGIFMIVITIVGIWMITQGCSSYNAQTDIELQHLKDSLSQVINNQINDVIGKDSIIIQYVEKPIPLGKKLVNENDWNSMVANCADISAELEKILKDNNYQSLDIEKYLAKIKELKIDLRDLVVQDSLDSLNNIKPNVTIKPTSNWNWGTILGVIGFVVVCLALLLLFKKLKK